MTDELGGRGVTRSFTRKTAEAKPYATVKVRNKCEFAEAQALNRLDEYAKQLETEAIVRARGAHHAITEIYSPPRITTLAKQMGLQPGYALDLTSRAPDGRFWDFSKARDRLKCWRLLRRDRPYLLIGSPPMHCVQCPTEPAQI